jgi:putative ABC transport system substrate-binding protein
VERRVFLGAVTGGLLAAPLAAEAQQAVKTYRVGFLSPGPAPPITAGLMAALGERGWKAGHNLLVESRFTGGDPQRAETLARELVQERVDVIVTHVTATAMAARRATSIVPIVMATSGFPVEGGLAKSLARPGGNVTGMTIYAGGGPLFGKYLGLLHELVPSMREFGVLWGYAPPSYMEEQVAPATDELRRAANVLNVKLRFWQTGRESDLQTALTAAAGAPLDALFVTGGVIHLLPEIVPRITRFILQQHLPTMTEGGPIFAEGGAVFAYSVDFNELAARTAYFVDRILKGAKPGDLPIEQPTKYVLSANLKAAKAIGLTIPRSVLAQADEVIE